MCRAAAPAPRQCAAPGQRIAAEQGAAARHVKDLYDLLPPNIDQSNYLFNTAIKAGTLKTTVSVPAGGTLMLGGQIVTYAGTATISGSGTLALAMVPAAVPATS